MGVQLCASTSNVRKLRKCEISSIVIVQKFSHLTRPRPVFSSHGRLTNIIMVCTRFPYFVKSSMPRLNAILIHGPSSRPWETFTYRFDVTYSVQLSKNIAIHRIKNYPAVECSKDVPRYPPNKTNPVYSFIRPTKTPDEVSIPLP